MRALYNSKCVHSKKKKIASSQCSQMLTLFIALYISIQRLLCMKNEILNFIVFFNECLSPNIKMHQILMHN